MVGVTNKVVRNEEIPRVGVITSYNKFNNTATVIISGRDSDAVDEIIRNVPCPTYMGIQSAAPEPGRMCIVFFKGGSITQPVIVSYFNHSFKDFEVKRFVHTEYSIPQYILGM